MTDPTRTEPNPDSPETLDTPQTNPEQHPDQSDVAPVVAEEPDAAQVPGPGNTAVAPGAGDQVTATAPATATSVPVETVELKRVRPAASRQGAAKRSPRPLQPYAIVETGGKQYRVSVGDRISIEKLPDAAGGEVTFDRVLLLGGDGTTEVGTPVVDGAAVVASVDDHFRGEKLVIFKYKAKKRYRRRTGHRQSLTHVTITGITR